MHEQQYDQFVTPAVIKDTILQALHDDLGHHDRDRTPWLVNTSFFWLGIDAYIDSKVRYCGQCVHQKTKPVLAAELINITSRATMDLVCIDYMSLEMSKGRFEQILVITDHFTCYAIWLSQPNNKLHRQLPGSCLTIFSHIMDFQPDFIATRPRILSPRLFSICVRWLVSRRL